MKKTEPIVISLFSYRGGTTKSTLALNFAMNFAKKGLKTVLIDLDLNSPQLHDMIDVKSDYYINDLYSTIIEPLRKNRGREAELREVIVPSRFANLDLILADPSLNLDDHMIIHTEKYSRQIFLFLQKTINTFKSVFNYQVIIFDCPGNLNYYSMYGAALANWVVGALVPSKNDVKGMKIILNIMSSYLTNKDVDLFVTLIPSVALEYEKDRFEEIMNSFLEMGIRKCTLIKNSEQLVYRHWFKDDYELKEYDSEYKIVDDYINEVLGGATNE